MKQVTLFVFTLIILPGCLVGPNYKKPFVALPKAFDEAKNSPTPNAQELDLAQWWHQFNDPYLHTLIEQALETNYNLRIALEKITEFHAFFKQTRAELFPQASLDGNITRRKFSRALVENTEVTLNPLTDYQLILDGSWEIDFFGKLRRAKQAALHDYQAQTEDMRNLYIILISDVATLYVSIRSTQKRIALLQELLTVNLELLELAQDRFQAGINSESPQLIQKQIVKQTKNEILQLQTVLQSSIYQLAALLGKNPDNFILQTKTVMIPQPHNPLHVGLPSDLLRRRPDIRQAEQQLMAANERVGESVAQWFPSFSLVGAIATRTNKGSILFASNSIAWQIGPSLNWPILNFGRIKAQVKAQESQYRQALLVYSNAIIKALAEVESALNAYFSEQEQLEVLTQRLQAAQTEEQLSRARFTSGLSSKIEYLQAQKQRIIDDFERVNAEQSLSTFLIAVYKALGGGW